MTAAARLDVAPLDAVGGIAPASLSPPRTRLAAFAGLPVTAEVSANASEKRTRALRPKQPPSLPENPSQTTRSPPTQKNPPETGERGWVGG